MNFTDEQLKAISHHSGNLQLIACAGSGKTEVVAQRIAGLLDPHATQRLTPANIVAFTFTNKAAAELKERIIDRVRNKHGEMIGLAEMFVGTIHSYCLDLLRMEEPEYLKFEVLNEVQQRLLVDRNSRQSGLTSTSDLRGRSLRRFRDTPHFIEAVNLLREASLVENNIRGASVVEGLYSYRNLLDQKRYLDYSAILELAVSTLRSSKTIQSRLANRIKHVIVDEYQDVNPIQEKLILLFAEIGAEICVVGDDDQTIYQWRGSDVQNILTFRKRYENVDEVRLQENFRSSRGIVETAREFISQNTVRLEKNMLPTDSQPYEPGDLIARSFDSPDDEAKFIADTILSLRGVAFTDPEGTKRGLSFSDVAVLLRSVRANGDPIIKALQNAGIPFIVGGLNNLFETGARQIWQ